VRSHLVDRWYHLVCNLMRWIKELVPRAIREWYWRQLAIREFRRRLYNEDQIAFGKEIARSLAPAALTTKRVSSVQLPGCRYPVYFRRDTSDVAVIRQVFGRKEYAAVQDLADVKLIIDCGANIGCTSFFLLHAYPDAHVIAIEPDRDNMDLCKKNLSPFNDRVTFVEAGIWDSTTPLKVVRGEFRDGEPWSYQVRPTMIQEEPDFLGVTLSDLLERSGQGTIDLLKVDVEGAEQVVFSADDLRWLNHTRAIAIELHDAESEYSFRKAVSTLDCELRQSGELTICQIKPASTSHLPIFA
jgi:FkbM family methyltransferase